MAKSSVLVTGGAGYIGSHTVIQLLEAGYNVTVMDNLSNADTSVLKRVKDISGRGFVFYAVDITHKEGLIRVFENEKIDGVIHFAGLKCVPESVEKPFLYYQNNVIGTLNLIDVMQRAGCYKIVFSSSATVYAADSAPPFKETDPLGAVNPYGMSKLMIENILRDLHASCGKWRIALLRYFNPIGAHKSGLIGDNPKGVPNNLLPYIQRVAAGELPYLNITGADYDTPDGTGVRDYIHIEDLARGHLAALRFLRGNAGCHAVNLGTGKGSSVFDIVKAFEAASGIHIPYEIKPRRSGDIAVSYADVTKAKELLGWEAENTLADMCKDAWRFARKNAQ